MKPVPKTIYCFSLLGYYCDLPFHFLLNKGVSVLKKLNAIPVLCKALGSSSVNEQCLPCEGLWGGQVKAQYQTEVYTDDKVNFLTCEFEVVCELWGSFMCFRFSICVPCLQLTLTLLVEYHCMMLYLKVMS